jgi:hypothetical protein
MTLAEVNWTSLRDLDDNSLKSEVFSIIRMASSQIQEGETDDPILLGVIPRLADLIASHDSLGGFKEVYSALARSVGLWNYIERNASDARDEIVAEFATVAGMDITLHREQYAALSMLLAGHNLILSAPTSFGKSLLVDAMLLDGRYKRVAIVLPTIALLDEFRRRLILRFGRKYDVLMHHSESSTSDHVIFLGTQERLINRTDLGYLDLVVVDEFYKLDPARKDERSVTLNAAVYNLLTRSKQFFFLGPNIENVQISADSRWKFSFLKTRFSTVAVDTYDLKGESDKPARLEEEIYRPSNWPALVFVSSPDKANKLASRLAEKGEKIGEGRGLASWMVENYGGKWELSEAVALGIGVHHGRIPRALASRFIRLFNDKKIPVLICTSTLIEGVNTAAKTVLIYDKKIARDDYDFFTYSNIRGRAGRLGQHHVGQVFLFHKPPEQEEVDVSAPLFGDLDDAPDEFVVHISDEDTTPLITDRIVEMADRVGMAPSELRRFSSIGIEQLEALRAVVVSAMEASADLGWTGRPTYEQLKVICEITCKIKKAQDFGCATASQLTMYISKLRSSSTLKVFFDWHSAGYRGEPQKIDNIFKFLRAVEYSLPEYFAAIELFVGKLRLHADYALLLSEMPRWFRSEALKILEEQGVPIQIAERFLRNGDTVTSLGRRLRVAAEARDQRLSALGHELINGIPKSAAG